MRTSVTARASYIGSWLCKEIHRTFVVRNASDPVQGVKVAAQGKSGLTNAKGKVTLALTGRGKSVLARATHSGWTGDELRLRVLRK